MFLLFLAVLIAIAAVIAPDNPEPERRIAGDVIIKLPEGYSYGRGFFGRHVDISPDGRQVVFAGRGPGNDRRLFLQTIGDAAPAGVPGTERGNDPHFSPDGRYIVFHDGETLKKTELDGSGTRAIRRVNGTRGVAWLDDNTLIVSNTEGPLLRMSISDGVSTPLTTSDLAHLSPSVLPGGKAVIYTVAAGPLRNARVWLLNLETQEERQLLNQNAFAARYLPSGHIVFATGSTRKLMAVAFDPMKLAVLGNPQTVLDAPVYGLGTGGSTDYSVSPTGVLIFTPRLEENFDNVLAEIADVDLTEIHVRLSWLEEMKPPVQN
jgi:Tol biopolymer transport system component